MTAPGAAPATIRIYSAAADLLAPLAYRKVASKLTRLGAAANRLCERRGEATTARPEGSLLWCHAASVGESLSVLPLVKQIGQMQTDLNFLITSGTQTSAEILANRLPERTTHQFAPLDSRQYLERFMSHWQPHAAIFVESELWPNMLRQTRALGIPMALVNARISDRSVRKWKRFSHSAQFLLDHFELIHCQDDRTQTHLAELGASHAKRGVNLKSLAAPLSFDERELQILQQTTAGRPVWLAASTHPGEEEIILNAHQTILDTYPDALLILVPRHPERGDAIKDLITEADLSAGQRSKGDLPDPHSEVYLADTLGEMGLWYTLCPLTVLCGSFSDVGGHNPYEPAQAGSFILHGPRYANFKHAYEELDAAGTSQQVANLSELTGALVHWIGTPETLKEKQTAAGRFATHKEEALETLAESLSNALHLV